MRRSLRLRASRLSRLAAAVLVVGAGVAVPQVAGAAAAPAPSVTALAPTAAVSAPATSAPTVASAAPVSVLPTGAPGTFVPVPAGVAELVDTTTSTTTPGAWNGNSYVSSANGWVGTTGAGSTGSTPPAAGAPLRAVPAGLGPIDHRDLVARALLGALVATGALALVARRRRPALRRRGVAIALAAATASVAVVPLATGGEVAAAAPPASARVADAPAVPALLTSTGLPASGSVAGPEAGVGQPLQIAIPALGVTAPVAVAAADPSGALQVPRAPTTVGWWAGGPVPGAASGTAVLASHVNYDGVPGAFAGLAALRPGDGVVVDGAQGDEVFRVATVTAYPKSALPWVSLFSSGGAGRLALVTCGGGFDPDTGHYADNVVVTAVAATGPTGGRAT
ncbi:MAG TPA: class F sortase [Acidimicrobiales bacterium]|nr:class F sortase [Acidimicrobiales bacterium]